MMNEVGALVHDLQTMGDMAVSKWKIKRKKNQYLFLKKVGYRGMDYEM